MKSKLTIKILGIVVTLATLTSLLVGLTAVPVSAANQMVFTAYSLPNNLKNFLGGQTPTFAAGATTSTTFVPKSNPDVNAVTASPDAKTIYTWDNTAKVLYMSADTGKTFSALGIATVSGTFIGLEASPKFATDGAVVLVTSSEVWLITGGLSSAVSITGDLPTQAEFASGGYITSFDIGSYYATGQLAIFVGISGGAGAKSNVLMFLQGGYTWAEVGATSTATGNGYLRMPDFTTDPQVIAVKLSPNYQSDAQVMAVYTYNSNTYLASNIAALGWNNSILTAATIVTGAPVATSAVIATGTDYFANSTGIVLVGTGSGLTTNGLFVVKNWIASTVPNVTLTPTYSGNVAVNGIAVSGPLATGSVVVSSPGSVTLNITTNVTATPPTWVNGATYRTASGAAITSMCYAGTNNAKLFVSSTGAPVTATNTGGAINVSADNGNTFNQIGVINVGTSWPSYGTISRVSDTNWYMIFGGGLFQSTDKGVSWTRIFSGVWSAKPAAKMSRSTAFATDNTFILTNGTNIALITSNGGSTYTPIGAPIAISTLTMIAGGAYYMYTSNTDTVSQGFYVSTRPYVNATFTPALATVDATHAFGINSVARSAKDTTGNTFALGTGDGKVYQSTDGGVTFTQLGTGPGTFSLTVGDRMSVAYMADGTLYAAATANTTSTTTSALNPLTAGIFKWVPATSQWVNVITIGTGIPYVSGFSVSTDGTMYATGDFNGSANINHGIYRSLNYNAVLADGTPDADWCAIDQTNYPGGTATVTVGTPYTGYPGTAGSSRSTVGVTSAATGNTLDITEATSAVTNAGLTGAIFSFVDSYIVGPTVVAPKDKTVLTTDKSVTMSWAAMNGPAGGAAASNTNYEVIATTSKDFTGYTTPLLLPTPANALFYQGLDYYNPGSLTQTAGINPGGDTTSLKGGTTYYWQIRAISPIPSRVTVSSFITALSAVNPAPVAQNPVPVNGAINIPVDTTFTWPAVVGTNVTYEFVIAQELGNADKFAIIDDSATTPTNAFKLRESLKYNTQYWWRVRAVSATATSAWTTMFFTTEKEPAAVTETTPAVTQTIIVPTQPAPIITVTNQVPKSEPVIPTYLLWAIIAVGAILIIAVIVLIVRTRRIS